MSVLDRETEITENTQIAKNTENTARSPRSAEVAASSAVVARDPHVTLVEGSSFCVSDHAGTIEPGGVHGLFVRDTRVLSRWKLYVDGYPVEPLTVVFDCAVIGGELHRQPGETESLRYFPAEEAARLLDGYPAALFTDAAGTTALFDAEGAE